MNRIGPAGPEFYARRMNRLERSLQLRVPFRSATVDMGGTIAGGALLAIAGLAAVMSLGL